MAGTPRELAGILSFLRADRAATVGAEKYALRHVANAAEEIMSKLPKNVGLAWPILRRRSAGRCGRRKIPELAGRYASGSIQHGDAERARKNSIFS